MRIIVIDFETYFADDYTLSRMTTESYVRDKRFETHGAAIKWNRDTPARWYDERQLREVLKNEDWSDVFLIAHHTQFDGLILSHHFSVSPKMYGCTLSMARLLLGNHISVSLDSVRGCFGLPAKRTPYHLFKGKHWRELDCQTQQLIAEGACDEVESIWQLFGILSKQFPAEEYEVLDTTLRMFTQPVLRADTELLAQIWRREENDKSARLAELGVASMDLQSAERFADLLRAEGIDPETKEGGERKDGSPPRQIYAFAKTDRFMEELLEDDNPRVRALAEARLGQKSTLMQTRANTLGWMASRGPLCVYLRYAGAGTLRPSGGDGANWLNFKRGSDIRRAILAPAGYLLAPVDASQIECRVLHYLAGGPDEPVIVKFRNKEDPYVDLASRFYKERIYKPKQDDPRRAEMEAKRGMGKQGRLMCGYGAAGPKFKVTAHNGLYGPPVEISLEEANEFVKLYREDNPSICAKNTGYWAEAGRVLARLAGGPPMQWGPLEVRDHRIYLPNGCPMIYDTLEYHKWDGVEPCREFETDGWWRVKTKRGWKKMWGSKLVQNCCESVSRVIVTQAMNRITRMGYRVLNHPYDELLCLVPRERGEEHAERCRLELCRDVPWLPGLPLDAEVVLGERYSK